MHATKANVTQADAWDDFWAVDEAAQTRERERLQRVSAHCESWACCWPEWEGPQVGGFCDVGGVIVHNLTHGGPRYHYCAPCRIVEIRDDRMTYIVEIAYPPGTVAHCFAQNGERLRLDILEVWAPVNRLRAQRHRQAT